MNVNNPIDLAIEELAARGTAFSSEDVADYAGLEGLKDTISGRLRTWRDNNALLPLDEGNRLRHLTTRVVENWWVAHTLRIASGELDYVRSAQLARSMSLSFLAVTEPRWLTPPDSVLEIGRRWAMLADGCVPGTYVFPWASLLIANRHLQDMFKETFTLEGSGYWFKLLVDDDKVEENWRRIGDALTDLTLYTPVDTAVDRVLSALTEREAYILKGRLGIDADRPSTLESLGARLGVTRERIRQIEYRTRQKLVRRVRARISLNSREPHRDLWLGFAADFIQTKGSLVIDEDTMTPRRRLALELIGLNTVEIPTLQLRVVAPEAHHEYIQGALNDPKSSPPSDVADPRPQIPDAFHFLPRPDGERLSEAWGEHRREQVSKTRAGMLREALRYLGRPAHFTEIAEVANRLFPERQNSTRNWHAALSYDGAGDLGIVWIGKKGVYGLTEHGYSRPSTDMFDAVATIVESRYGATGSPVPFDFVLTELRKQRTEPMPNSVAMALGFNERVTDLGGGRYVPNSCAPEASSDSPSEDLDFEAAFAAFSDGRDP